jgi:hypothetical protein
MPRLWVDHARSSSGKYHCLLGSNRLGLRLTPKRIARDENIMVHRDCRGIAAHFVGIVGGERI